MKSEGVSVRPLRQMSGDSGFNEVFFTNVRVPVRYLLGELNEGWKQLQESEEGLTEFELDVVSGGQSSGGGGS